MNIPLPQATLHMLPTPGGVVALVHSRNAGAGIAEDGTASFAVEAGAADLSAMQIPFSSWAPRPQSEDFAQADRNRPTQMVRTIRSLDRHGKKSDTDPRFIGNLPGI